MQKMQKKLHEFFMKEVIWAGKLYQVNLWAGWSFQEVRGRGWRGKASMKEPGVEL